MNFTWAVITVVLLTLLSRNVRFYRSMQRTSKPIVPVWKLSLQIQWNYLRGFCGWRTRKVFWCQTVVLDGLQCQGAVFNHCRLIYCGGSVALKNCTFNSLDGFHYYGAAANSLQLMAHFFQLSPGMLEETFGVELAHDSPTPRPKYL